MKKLLFSILIFLCFKSHSQNIRVLTGLDPVSGRPGYIYRDTSINLPNAPLKFFNGYGEYGSLLDSINNRNSNVTLQTDTVSLCVFGGGGGNAMDTSTFTTSTIYGSLFTGATDTLIITKMLIGLQGTSASITVDIFWNDSLNISAGATKLVTSGTAATNLYTGTSVTSFNNSKIPPNNFLWCKTSAVTTKPTFLTVTLIGYKKRAL